MSNSIDFRDKIATVDEEGKRIWINPKKPSGKLYKWRTYFSYLLLLILFGTPFIKMNGHPYMLFNIIERKFILFGIPFWPQDSELFAVGLLIIFVFVILFTAVYGRLWCGWACPQTIFMEMIFRKIEYWIEGDPAQQQKLNRMPLNGEKLLKKGLKHILFFALAFLIGNTFLAYIIGIDDLLKIITDPPAQHVAGLIAMLLFSGLFYWIYAFFREQVCTLVCPYGRLQSVLLDKNSIVVSYDFIRGEPRARYNPKDKASEAGDCIDCKQCVKVCPTGIDIRNGTQLECVNCTACIDACNNVMSGINRKLGLIRYASYNGIKEGKKKVINGRSMSYSTVLVLLIIIFSLFFSARTITETTILRASGSLPINLNKVTVRNLYTVKIINKSFDDLNVQIRLLGPNGKSQLISGDSLKVQSQDLAQSALFVDLRRNLLSGKRTPVEIGVFDGEKLLEKINTNFLAPGDMQFK